MNLDSLKNLLTAFIDETDALYFGKSRKVYYRDVLYYNILCNLDENGLRKANARFYERTRCDVAVSTLR